MDLRNGTITLGELLQNPKANAVLQRRFGSLLQHPMIGAAKGMSLQQIIQRAGKNLSAQTIQQTLDELKQL